MFSVYNILTIAKFETKTLFRSWFFRVFAILTVGILGFLNILFFTDAIDVLPWSLRGLPGSIPYLNMLFYNIAQAIIAVFMASDFLKRDYKLNTTEVIYMRSMTNGDYILGKLLGILFVFVSLNLLVYIFALVINLVFADVPVYFSAYAIYFLLMSLPSLIFIIGLAFISMILIKNQALTFILVLGYVAITLFFVSTKINYLFDYMCWYIPLAFSDFTGFTDLGPIIIQRLLYLSLGLAFIFLTIVSIRRLPQSQFLTKLSTVLAVVLFIFVGALGFIHYSDYSQFKSARSTMIALNDQQSSTAIVSVKSCNLQLEHIGENIAVNAELGIVNENSEMLEKIVFSLNPGLEVNTVKINNNDVQFEQNFHLLTLNAGLQVGEATTVQMNYSGRILQSSSYLDVDDEQFNLIHNIGPYKLEKKYGYLKANYVLLTKENLWYPVPGVTHGSKILPQWKKDFINFALSVKTREGLTVISQGELLDSENGTVKFVPENPLSQISLVIGNYEKRSIVVDSVEFSLYTHSKHNHFVPYFSAIGDTIGSLIRDTKQEFESKVNLDYAFPRMSLIEVPAHYVAFERRISSVVERIQPEQMFLPENGLSLYSTDFKRTKKYSNRRNKDMNRDVSEKQTQTSMLTRFLSEFQGNSMRRRHGGINVNFAPEFSLIPLYFQYVSHLEAKEYPLLGDAFESFLNTKYGGGESIFGRFFTGMSDDEKANLILRDNSLAQLLTDTEHFDQIKDVIRVKSDFLFKRLVGTVGQEKFDNYLDQLLNEHKFKPIKMEQFITDLQNKFGINFLEWLGPWRNDTSLPGLFVSNIKAYEVLKGNMSMFQASFTLSNEKSVPGLVAVEFRGGGRRGDGHRFGPPAATDLRIINIEGDQAKQVFILLDEEPRMMSINTIMAENLPQTFIHRIEDIELDKNAVPFDGEKMLDEIPPFTLPGEYIVDNEDSSFTVETGEKKSMLQRFLKIEDEDEEYSAFRFYRPPSNWRKTTFDDFYGKYIHSAYFIRSGGGEKTATWTANLESSGQYDVFAFNPQIQMRFGRGRGRGGDRGGSNYVGELHFKIYHDDGVEELLLDAPNADQGWNLLGSYYLSQGEAKVEISNESNDRLVIADAIKWIKK
jgi:hypothetical protein